MDSAFNPGTSAAILPEPPDELKQLSGRLCTRLSQAIAQDGPMPFGTWMERVLYEPGLGYYSAGLHKLGADGDFVTAPELGPVFAQCLARQVAEIAAELGDYEILELGAGSGRLAADLLDALEPNRRPVRYRILERSADLRAIQQRALGAHSATVEWLDAPPGKSWTGVLLANEVVDALPVERFQLKPGRIEQLYVDDADGDFDWLARPAPARLEQAVRTALGEQRLATLPNDYRSEICTMLAPWLDEVTHSLRRGCALLVDYGYARNDYYAPERSDGTLVCHYRHRGHDDPFFHPGLQDISAFVDFTALAKAADACGLEVSGYTSQAAFLLGCGLQDILAAGMDLPQRERMAFASEVRELTLPGAMGERFQVMALTRALDLPLRGFAASDLRHRL